jgi:hypothetical protein
MFQVVLYHKTSVMKIRVFTICCSLIGFFNLQAQNATTLEQTMQEKAKAIIAQS